MQAINKHTFVKNFLASKRNCLKTKENTKKVTKVTLIFKIKTILNRLYFENEIYNKKKKFQQNLKYFKDIASLNKQSLQERKNST